MTTKTMLGLIVMAIGLMTTPAFAQTDTPYKQFNEGIPINQIQCSDSKILLESARNSPACVNEISVEKFLDRGFTRVVLKDIVDSDVKTKILYLNSSSYDDPKNDYPPDSGHVNPKTTLNMSENVIIINDEILDYSRSSIDVSQDETTSQNLILNPTNIDDLIPQDFKLEYAFRTFTDDPDDVVYKLTELHDDKITKKNILPNGVRYDTQKGSIKIYDDYTYDFPIKYTLFGKDRINPEKAEETTLNLLDDLGITLDGTELFQYEPAQTASYTFWISQQKDGFMIQTNQIKTTFDAGYTFFHIGNWNINISEFDMYDFSKSKENAIKYLSSTDKLTGQDCDVKYKKELKDRYDSVLILDGYPVYQIYSGTCQVEIWDGHYLSYHTIVDALSGEPLFAKNMVLF